MKLEIWRRTLDGFVSKILRIYVEYKAEINLFSALQNLSLKFYKIFL